MSTTLLLCVIEFWFDILIKSSSKRFILWSRRSFSLATIVNFSVLRYVPRPSNCANSYYRGKFGKGSLIRRFSEFELLPKGLYKINKLLLFLINFKGIRKVYVCEVTRNSLRKQTSAFYSLRGRRSFTLVTFVDFTILQHVLQKTSLYLFFWDFIYSKIWPES